MTNRAPRPWLAVILGLCALLASCGGDSGAATQEASEGSPEIAAAEGPTDAGIETRHRRVMAIHDEVMPERARLVRLQRELERAPEQNLAYSSARSRLAAADEAMMAWMYADVPLTELVDSLGPEALNAYLDERELTIRDVADSMRVSIAVAEALLAQPD